jgi:hypothetical protein
VDPNTGRSRGFGWHYQYQVEEWLVDIDLRKVDEKVLSS